MTVGTMEKERRTVATSATGFKLHSSKRKIDLMRGPRVSRDQEKFHVYVYLTATRTTRLSFLFFFLLLFRPPLLEFCVSSPSFFLGCARFTALWWFVPRSGGSFDQKTRVASNKNGKKTIIRFQFFFILVVSFFFIFPLFCFFSFFLFFFDL